MESFLSILISIGLGLIIGWLFYIIVLTLFMLIAYKFNDKKYTHPKWHIIFPYIFTIEYKVELPNGQRLIFTNRPYLLELPFIGGNKHTVTREIFTEKYINSAAFKEASAAAKRMVQQHKNKN